MGLQASLNKMMVMRESISLFVQLNEGRHSFGPVECNTWNICVRNYWKSVSIAKTQLYLTLN